MIPLIARLASVIHVVAGLATLAVLAIFWFVPQFSHSAVVTAAIVTIGGYVGWAHWALKDSADMPPLITIAFVLWCDFVTSVTVLSFVSKSWGEQAVLFWVLLGGWFIPPTLVYGMYRLLKWVLKGV